MNDVHVACIGHVLIAVSVETVGRIEPLIYSLRVFHVDKFAAGDSNI